MHCLGEWQGSGATLHSPYECPAHTRCPETGQALPFVGNDSIAAAGLVGGAFSSFSFRLESAFHRSWGLCGGAVWAVRCGVEWRIGRVLRTGGLTAFR